MRRRWAALPPDIEPRATDHIPEMLAIIGRLIDNGHAYAKDGHVLFDVTSWPDYGVFSGRDRDEQIAGARVEVAPYKRTRRTSFCGNRPRDGTRVGTAPGGTAVRAGISNARP